MACLPEDRLLDLAEGRLAGEGLSGAEEHLDACAACRHLLVTLLEGRAAPPPAQVGRYRLGQPLGAGGLGIVYEAQDPQLQRPVALKLLHAASEAAREPLLREARALARLAHPHVVAIFDAGEDDGRAWIAMERLPGPTLARWLRERDRPWAEVAQAFLQAGEGLAAAHAQGLVHRDFKPENVLRAGDGSFQVTDFGHALPVRERGARGGTPRYMAPEQARGAPADARADVYSFSVALRDALAPLRPRPPGRLLRALESGAATDPAARPPTLEPLLALLRAALGARRRRPWLLAGGAAALLILALAVAGGLREARLSRLAARQAATEAAIAELLSRMRDEPSPARLAELERALLSLSEQARADATRLTPREDADPLRAALRRLLRRLGADPLVVPPVFEEAVRRELARRLSRPTLPAVRARCAAFLPQVEGALRERGLPTALSAMVLVESACDPSSTSTSGARGPWQLMPETARRFGLRVDGEVDERTDVEKSSRAAARYLAQLLADFGADGFLLALASYNAGETAVRGILHQLADEPGGLRPEDRDFWHLYRRRLLSEETRNYVPAVIAAGLLLAEPGLLGLAPVAVPAAR